MDRSLLRILTVVLLITSLIFRCGHVDPQSDDYIIIHMYVYTMLPIYVCVYVHVYRKFRKRPRRSASSVTGAVTMTIRLIC